MILIATPARASTPRPLLERCEQVVNWLSWDGPVEWRLHLNDQPKSGEKYEPNANARNEFIDLYLRPEHQWVLWFDADIIEAPSNLIEVLMDTAQRHDGQAIVAPMVWVERVGGGRPSIPVGGWFYDTGGFQRLDGTFADFEHGVAGDEDETEMASVGCVYLAPAALYRQGLRYRPKGGEVEHLSFMREARKAGFTVWATRKVNVTHAYLPKWGEQWHSS